VRGGHYETSDYETDYTRRDYYQHSPGYAGTWVAMLVRDLLYSS